MNTKNLVSLAAAAVVMLTSSVTAAAETVNNDLQEISVTLSVDEFADLASDYGCSVAIGGGGDVVEPRMHKTVTHTFTKSDTDFYDNVGIDSTILPETVQLQNITLSDNIKSVDVYLVIHVSDKTEVTYNIGQNGKSKIYDVAAGVQYKVYMRAHAKNEPLSASNKGTVSFYWTDRSWEVTE